jgi:phosphate starvation-inducible PhoH-like protein
LPLLFGEHNAHLHYIEDMLGLAVSSRGNEVTVKGAKKEREIAEKVLKSLWEKAKRDQTLEIGDVDGAIRFARGEKGHKPPQKDEKSEKSGFFDEKDGFKVGQSKIISPRSPNQKTYIEAIKQHDMVFGVGPAGTGKTFLAVAAAVEMYKAGEIERMIFTRPAVEAGEQLGFLPGDLLEKIDPYLRPIYDALHDLMPGEQVSKKISNGDIEIAPLAFMRGRTLRNAFVILDEAQNTTSMQMKMFLTRMGEGTRMVITGDPTQVDLPPGQTSGLKEAMTILQSVKDVAFIHFDESDVVRHKLVGKIIKAYNTYEFRNGANH